MYEIVYYLAMLAGLLPIGILLYRKKAFEWKEGILPFIWLTAFATVYEHIGTYLLGINSAYWFQIYSLLEIACLFYYFKRLFEKKYINALYLMLGILLFAFVVSCFYWTDTSLFVPLAVNAASVSSFVFIFSYLHFSDLISDSERSMKLQTNFYFTVGFSVYYSTTLLLFLFSEYLDKTTTNIDEYWIINIFAGLILRSLLTIGTWRMQPD